MPDAGTTKARHQVWIIRAGRQAEIVADFLKKNVVAVGWSDIGQFPVKDTWEPFRAEIRKRLPESFSQQRVGAAAGQLWAFINEIKKGDYVVTPDKHTRQVHVGVVEGDYKYDPDFDTNYPRTRAVRWLNPVDWDSLPPQQANSFTAWQTIHQPEVDFSSVLGLAESPQKANRGSDQPPTTPEVVEAAEENLSEKAEEAIRSRLQSVHFDDFQRLVGAVLKAAGFVILFDSAGKGKDAGIDLIASKDSLGAGEKIIVQVKHRKGAVEQKELQQLVGTLKANEYGLMVSTGGITSDASRYWRDHRDRLLKPLEASAFIALLGDVYERLDSEFKAMLPLKKAYVPVVSEEY